MGADILGRCLYSKVYWIEFYVVNLYLQCDIVSIWLDSLQRWLNFMVHWIIPHSLCMLDLVLISHISVGIHTHFSLLSRHHEFPQILDDTLWILCGSVLSFFDHQDSICQSKFRANFLPWSGSGKEKAWNKCSPYISFSRKLMFCHRRLVHWHHLWRLYGWLGQ